MPHVDSKMVSCKMMLPRDRIETRSSDLAVTLIGIRNYAYPLDLKSSGIMSGVCLVTRSSQCLKKGSVPHVPYFCPIFFGLWKPERSVVNHLSPLFS